MAWKPQSHLPLFTLHILLEKLECWDPPLTSLISYSELSVTGDTAKYLVLTLSRGCARSPLDSINPNYPLHSFSEKEKEEIETRLFRSCFPMIIPGDHRPPINPTSVDLLTQVHTNLLRQDRAHMTCGCTRSYWTRRVYNLFKPGWLSTIVHFHQGQITIDMNHRHGPPE